MRIALCQMSNSGNRKQNLEKSLAAIQTAAQNSADLILFPEVQLTEFFPQYPGKEVSSYGLTIDSEEVNALAGCCRENHIMSVPNIYLKEGGQYYDASILIDKNGEIAGIQKMVHVAYADRFYESDYYTPSDDGFHVFETDLGKIGIVVCFDRHYPESVRTEALKGADLVLIPTVNTTAEPMKMFEMEIQVQAFQNSVFIAMCNRVGREDQMEFSGESIVVSPNGETIAKAGAEEEILYCDLNPVDAGAIRSQKNYTNLRRPEWYVE